MKKPNRLLKDKPPAESRRIPQKLCAYIFP
jgi:hypothetical protein